MGRTPKGRAEGGMFTGEERRMRTTAGIGCFEHWTERSERLTFVDEGAGSYAKLKQIMSSEECNSFWNNNARRTCWNFANKFARMQKKASVMIPRSFFTSNFSVRDYLLQSLRNQAWSSLTRSIFSEILQ